jgi:thiol-disulfide isomerase/thioredoxin
MIMYKTLKTFTFLVLSCLILSCSSGADSDKAIKEADKYQGEDWTLKNLAGEPVQLSSFHGQPTILVFWATWCPFCKKLLPGIAELDKKYRDQGLKVLAVNIKEDWKPEVYWRNHEYEFDTVLEGDEVAKLYGVKGTPGIVFIAPSGEVLGVKSFSDPNHPLLEKFAEQGIALMKIMQENEARKTQ